MTQHVKRILTAFTIIPVLIGIICFAPSVVFCALCLFAALICLNEFYSLIKPKTSWKILVPNYFLAVALFFFLFKEGILYVAVIPLFVIINLISFLKKKKKNHLTIGDIGQIIIGPLYTCVPMSFLVIIERLPEGAKWIFFILTVVIISDTASFYSGKFLGIHKLTHISPGKTWEGSIGGLIASVFSGILFCYVFFPYLSMASVMIVSVAVSISGQIGDLAESMLKRMSNVKDSGAILPGHGGVLDRVDSLLFAIPVLYLYLSLQRLH